MTKNCLNPKCKKEFTPKNKKGVYCSADCRSAHAYQLKNGKPQEIVIEDNEDRKVIEIGSGFIIIHKSEKEKEWQKKFIEELKDPNFFEKFLAEPYEQEITVKEKKATPKESNSTKFKTYDYSAMPKGMMYAAQQKWKKQARIEQDKNSNP